MSACRTGCKEQSHSTYAECLQSANVRVADTINSPMQSIYENTKKDLKAYQQARADGIQPEGTSREKIDRALKATSLLGRPYNANKDAPASMISTKAAARFSNLED